MYIDVQNVDLFSRKSTGVQKWIAPFVNTSGVGSADCLLKVAFICI